MTLPDEITMVEGQGTSQPYVFYMAAQPKLCIPAMGEEDGPIGVGDGLTGVTELPSAVSLAATFDPSLARRYGQVVGAEEAGKGASVNLGPTVNIDRDPRWGRSFETYTEDPYLNATLATSEIEGVQSQRVLDQVKHFDAYNQETNRNTALDDVLVSDRALHEIYGPAFQAAIQQAKAASVMCAYSVVNGNYSCQNPYLEQTELRDQWGFPGFVTSDYGAIHETAAATDGTDEEQPFNSNFGQPLLQAVRDGTISRTVLNTMVSRMLAEMFRFNLLSDPRTGSTSTPVTTPAHVALSNQVAQDGTTLLKNSGSVLPLLATDGGNVAVIGPAASASPTYAGGGSAYVLPSATVSPLQGIKRAAGTGTTVSYTQGLPTDASLPAIPSADLTPAYSGTPSNGDYQGTLTAPQTGTYVLGLTNSCGCYSPTYLKMDNRALLDVPSTPPVHTYSVAVHLQAGHSYHLQISGQSSAFTWATPSALAPGIAKAVTAAKSASTAVVVVSDDTETEAADRLGLNLPSAQDELISAVAAANPHTVVVINAGAPVAMPWLDQVAGVLDAWYPGQTSGRALASVLFGTVDPSGHLPVTFPASLSGMPTSAKARFPGVNGKVHYSEGILVGYRWYDANNVPPLFPFGYGLSYTTFGYSDLRIGQAKVSGISTEQVTATVTNTGTRTGSDVAQLYLGDPAGTGEPPRQLVGYQRVTLAPGQSTQATFDVTPRDTWWWDQAGGGWSQTAGTYRVYVGDSSAPASLPLQGSFDMTSTPAARQAVVTAPHTIKAGQPVTVQVKLTASGNETLHGVTFGLRAPQGWTVTPAGPTVFGTVSPGESPVVSYTVQPPPWAPAASSVLYATVGLGGQAQRQDGTTVTVTG
ncbi:MAG TPA: glycoside hydrolase family 3 C-terminal domain-containing protein [Streptosporangiaceae bacterium]|nr:glycoside hydrolase family 3 C-terminal domain-containing protein [Streptosporangiaceae bacterium]